MPTYNGARHLCAALESVAVQDTDDLEIIAVDDGSTDETLSILESYSGRLPVQIARREHIGNWVANTNYGLSLARGEYVCCLHQDDYWLNSRLQVLRARAAAKPAAVLLLHPSWYVDEKGNRLGMWRCPLPSGELESDFVVERLLVQNFIAMPAPLFKRSALSTQHSVLSTPHCRMDESLWYTADWDLWLKLAAAGKTVYIPEPLACFRLHEASQTAQRSSNRKDYRGQLEVVLDRHLPVWRGGRSGVEAVAGAARLSVEVNASLAASFHGQRPEYGRLARACLNAGPAGWRRFVRDSRIWERLGARMRLLRQRQRRAS